MFRALIQKLLAKPANDKALAAQVKAWYAGQIAAIDARAAQAAAFDDHLAGRKAVWGV